MNFQNSVEPRQNYRLTTSNTDTPCFQKWNNTTTKQHILYLKSLKYSNRADRIQEATNETKQTAYHP